MSDEAWKKTMDLEDALTAPVRVAILLFLLPRTRVTFSTMQKALKLTAGNLSSHLKKLEKEQFVMIEKKFVDNKPTTVAEITSIGHSKIVSYIKALQTAIE